MASLWESPLLLETRVAQIISKQGKQGCNFNKKKAAFGVYILSERIARIDTKLIPQLPQMMNRGNEFKKPFLKSGKFSKYAQEYADLHGLQREEVGGPFSRVWYTPFDPSKTDRIKHVMMGLGWEPAVWNIKKSPLEDIKHLPPAKRIIAEDTLVMAYINKNVLGHSPEYTNQILKAMNYKKPRTIGNLKAFIKKERYWTTSPKITPDEDKFSGSSDILELIRQRMVWSHRRALLRGLIDLIREDGKIEGGANPCATPTARMRHRGIVNIPSGHAPFGAWCRSLFFGDYDPTITKGHVYRKKLGKDERIKPGGTNIIQELKKGKWKDVGPWRSFVPAGRQTFVGYDGAGLELRMFAHYINCPNYIHQILEGDIHSYNQELAGLPTRGDAKTFNIWTSINSLNSGDVSKR